MPGPAVLLHISCQGLPLFSKLLYIYASLKDAAILELKKEEQLWIK